MILVSLAAISGSITPNIFPGAEAYQKYYETIDPSTAEYLYKQVVEQVQTDKQLQEYAELFPVPVPVP